MAVRRKPWRGVEVVYALRRPKALTDRFLDDRRPSPPLSCDPFRL